ncbi:MAG: sulfoxide reductase heme-binding subunit YedZ [Gemmatimonadota bacterium]|nr:MAG: sulfoxide reductase heme-binding subunit YedZ [Gemmatimonadota bacterium]
MTRVQFVRWVLKPAVFAASLAPLGVLVRDALTGGLGANPVEEITHRTGLTAITFLTLTLAVTPASQLLGAGWLVRFRRMLGLFAFTYAVLHFLMYVADQTWLAGQGLSLALVAEDVAERPYITVGFSAFLLLVPLAVTSTRGWVRRLGGKRWQRLHQLVYVAAAGAVFHFLWLVKADTRRPALYGGALVLLLGYRLARRRAARRRRTASIPAPAAPEESTASG